MRFLQRCLQCSIFNHRTLSSSLRTTQFKSSQSSSSSSIRPTSCDTSLLDSSGDRLANLILFGVSAPDGVISPEGVVKPTWVAKPEGVAKLEGPGRGGVSALDSEARETRRLAVRDLREKRKGDHGDQRQLWKIETDIQSDGDRQKERQTDGETKRRDSSRKTAAERQKNRKTEEQKDRRTERQTDKHAVRQKGHTDRRDRMTQDRQTQRKSTKGPSIKKRIRRRKEI